jgi:hypothetical protein
MSDKQQHLTQLTTVFNRWEALLSRLSEEELTAPQLPEQLSIKDVIGHLRAWQQVSIARMAAAQRNQEPVMPGWLAGLDPESEEDREQFNATIYATYQHQPWSQVHGVWRDGFLRFLKLAEELPEADLVDTKKYPWLNGYALVDVLQGSYEHHLVDHLEPLLAWLSAHGEFS